MGLPSVPSPSGAAVSPRFGCSRSAARCSSRTRAWPSAAPNSHHPALSLLSSRPSAPHHPAPRRRQKSAHHPRESEECLRRLLCARPAPCICAGLLPGQAGGPGSAAGGGWGVGLGSARHARWARGDVLGAGARSTGRGQMTVMSALAWTEPARRTCDLRRGARSPGPRSPFWPPAATRSDRQGLAGTPEVIRAIHHHHHHDGAATPAAAAPSAALPSLRAPAGRPRSPPPCLSPPPAAPPSRPASHPLAAM